MGRGGYKKRSGGKEWGRRKRIKERKNVNVQDEACTGRMDMTLNDMTFLVWFDECINTNICTCYHAHTQIQYHIDAIWLQYRHLKGLLLETPDC